MTHQTRAHHITTLRYPPVSYPGNRPGFQPNPSMIQCYGNTRTTATSPWKLAVETRRPGGKADRARKPKMHPMFANLFSQSLDTLTIMEIDT